VKVLKDCTLIHHIDKKHHWLRCAIHCVSGNEARLDAICTFNHRGGRYHAVGPKVQTYLQKTYAFQADYVQTVYDDTEA
jgi:hypothetical protein